mmetsp:Transcript_26705/g.82146  ORF Transcript_26705/g.82146 Transcript_26705/m.82146 type:complete len:84 (+) Transcript_26705:1909-2160(+)
MSDVQERHHHHHHMTRRHSNFELGIYGCSVRVNTFKHYRRWRGVAIGTILENLFSQVNIFSFCVSIACCASFCAFSALVKDAL